MIPWVCEVIGGKGIPSTLDSQVEESKKQGGAIFLQAEAGMLFNEPEETYPVSIKHGETPTQAIGDMGRVLSWLFGLFESGAYSSSQCQWNYFKITCVNLKPSCIDESNPIISTGFQLTTNTSELPRPSEQSPTLMFGQFVTTLRNFFEMVSEFHGDIDDANNCEWISMILNKVPPP